MTENDLVAAARKLQQQYDRCQCLLNILMVPRSWESLPQHCKDEFLEITRIVAQGGDSYKGEAIPAWVKSIVERNYHT